MCEVLNANATLHTTWSRLAGELITWSSYEYRTVTLDDGFAMGSSMMPQKKNPGPCELLRGRQGIMSGYATAGLTLLHGLPSGYSRDFHEEKELLFASCEMANRAAAIQRLMHELEHVLTTRGYAPEEEETEELCRALIDRAFPDLTEEVDPSEQAIALREHLAVLQIQSQSALVEA